MKLSLALLFCGFVLCLEFADAGKGEKPNKKATKKKNKALQCNPPFWHAKWGLNSLGSHFKGKDYPKFQLSVKGYNETFTAGQRYKVVLETAKGKKNPKINGVYFTVDAAEECTATGKFAVAGAGGKKAQKKALATKSCKTMAVLTDQTGQSLPKATTNWRAPKETAPGCTITMRATVLADDGILYYDGDYEEADFQHLTVALTPSPAES